MKSEKRRVVKQRLATLPLLVAFVFIILVISILFSVAILYILLRIGIFPTITESRLPVISLFLLVTSVFIGTLIAAIGGGYFLRPLQKLTEATKEVTAGNYDISVEPHGTAELEQLAISFNEMTKELSTIETLRSDFVSNISHEFKTPVVSIRGFARRIKKDALTERQNEYVDIIIAETERLSELSQNVLLLSNLESSDRISTQVAYSLDEQIRKCILMLEPFLDKKQLELEVELESIQIISNEEMINHLWTNLLGNAIKFSLEGGTIKVTSQTDEGYALISVCDEGIGMDENTKAHVFDKFYQGDPSRATQGNGLGLSLVKRILHLTGGTIAVKSAPRQGTCFIVRLPIGTEI